MAMNVTLVVVRREHDVLRDRLRSRLGHFVFSKKKLYTTKVVGHHGCVNAIDSNNEYVASAGDDQRVLLWPIGDALTGSSEKRVMEGRHELNVFSVSFDCLGCKLFSGGNDELVLVHDLVTAKKLESIKHEDIVFAVHDAQLLINCLLTKDPNVLLTTCLDSSLRLFDLRVSVSSSTTVARSPTSNTFKMALFNPTLSHLVASASRLSGLQLWDIRMCSTDRRRNDHHCDVHSLLSYERPTDTMSLAFDSIGQHIFVLRRRRAPLLFNINSPKPVVKFDDDSYFNSCTSKRGCFVGLNDDFVASGSDDFNIHLWRIPKHQDRQDILEVKTSTYVLKGHRSIVNQVRYNTNYELIASSGIEKSIRFWSTLPIGVQFDEDDSDKSEERVIELLPSRNSNDRSTLDFYIDTESTEEDPRMLDYFDACLQREDMDDASSSNDQSSLSDSSTDEMTEDTSQLGPNGRSDRCNKVPVSNFVSSLKKRVLARRRRRKRFKSFRTSLQQSNSKHNDLTVCSSPETSDTEDPRLHLVSQREEGSGLFEIPQPETRAEEVRQDVLEALSVSLADNENDNDKDDVVCCFKRRTRTTRQYRERHDDQDDEASKSDPNRVRSMDYSAYELSGLLYLNELLTE